MAWDTEMVRMLRYLINDLDSPPAYDDDRLAELILVAAQYVGWEITFNNTYEIDLENLTLTPDPTDRSAGTREDAFINLVVLKAACMVDSSEARVAAAQAITIRDGSSMIALGGSGGVLEGRLTLLEKGFCSAYQKLKEEYVKSQVVSYGAMVTGPTGCGGNNWRSSYPTDGRYR